MSDAIFSSIAWAGRPWPVSAAMPDAISRSACSISSVRPVV